MTRPDWESIKREYTAGELSIRAIAEKYGVSDTAIRKAAKKEGWIKNEKVRKTGSHLPTANQSANLRTSIKEQGKETPVNSRVNSVISDNEQDDDWHLNPDEYGLTELQAKFVIEYLIDMDKTAAYQRAGYKSQGETGAAAARRLYRNVSVNRAIRDALTARERRTQITQDAVLKMWWDIATADVNELTEYRRLCCRHCWGFGFNYQWRDSIEFEDAIKKALTANKPPPQDVGGYGYDETLDPNPDCPRCNGAGIGRAYFHDTRDLTGPARRVFAGVKEGKFGVEVITRNQDEALKMVAQHLGMLKNKTELTGADGGPIQTTGIDLSHLSFEQLLQLRKKGEK
ncbi:TPA: terminase small subunit [Proteus mirabilis]|nr:terminase small subunit [Proteus mirabilis]HEK1077753.1 terminase small subunit [Proteus mirabilis]HEK2105445.1 terminase small subunit [Proteus mirabilis]